LSFSLLLFAILLGFVAFLAFVGFCRFFLLLDDPLELFLAFGVF
jgi:hypothetical protein